MVSVLLEAGLKRIPVQHCLKLVMQKYSVCASRVIGASREDKRVKNESMLGLELSRMKYYDA